MPLAGDFDGDRKCDLATVVGDTQEEPGRGRVWVALSTGSSFGPGRIWHEELAAAGEETAVGDFDGDGRDDIAAFASGAPGGAGRGDVRVALSTGTSLGPAVLWSQRLLAAGEVPAAGDFDGDGKDDLAGFVQDSRGEPERADVWVALSTGAGFAPPGRWHEFFSLGGEVVAAGDVDGDGKADILTFVRDAQGEPGRGNVWVALSTGAGFAPGRLWHEFFSLGEETPAVADFDGDGLDDAITFVGDTQGEPGRGNVWVALSSGSAFGPGAVWHADFAAGGEAPRVGDVDGDGRADIVALVRDARPEPGRGDVRVALSSRTNGMPGGFVLETVASGLQTPVAAAFAPDGRVFVAEKRGQVRVVKDGRVLREPLIDLRDEVQNAGDKGLLGIVLHPEFARNGQLFLLYVVDPEAGQPDEADQAPAFGRLSRYTARGDTADPASRVVLIGKTPRDGFLHCHSSHTVGSVRFGAGGSLFVGSGDGAHFNFTDGGQDETALDPGCELLFGPEHDLGALRSPSLESLAGKVLRIDAESGAGLPSNPFFDGDPFSARSRVWVRGLRNPFRFAVRPGSAAPGVLYIGDVGWGTWEEMNVARGGEDFGWPCREGSEDQPAYQGDARTGPACRGLRDSPKTDPLFAWHNREPGGLGFIGHCAAGVAFYTAARYPARYRGACFFADYGRSWIKVAWVDEADRLLSIEDFASNLDRPVDLGTDPATGDLHYVSIAAGEVRRIAYRKGNHPPAVVLRAEPAVGKPPLEVRFSSEGTLDPDCDPVTVEWDFGDGSAPSRERNPVHVYGAAGVFTAAVTARDDAGGSASGSIAVDTTNSAPEVAVVDPPDGSTFYGGETLVLRARAIDLEDGEALGRSWEVRLHHQDHVHPEWMVSSEAEPAFRPVSHGDGSESYWYEIMVAVADRRGVPAEARVRLVPGRFRRGDGNLDRTVEVADPIVTLGHLFLGAAAPCPLALDADGDGDLALTDAVVQLQHLFLAGPPPAPPFPDCGVGANPAGLACAGACL